MPLVTLTAFFFTFDRYHLSSNMRLKILLFLAIISMATILLPLTGGSIAHATITHSVASATPDPITFHQVLKEKFIEGDPMWMAPILLCLIIGLSLAIERILYLNFSAVNAEKLLGKLEKTINQEGIAAGKELCRNTPGPLAGIFFQGLDRHEEGLDMVEKSMISYGSVMMGRLEKNLTWISLFISIAPMLGFLGTVVGMVKAFDAIEAAGDISASIVAGGIRVALLTTVFGLIVAMILQIFYNYIISKIDAIVNTMEDATITFMDILIRNRRTS